MMLSWSFDARAPHGCSMELLVAVEEAAACAASQHAVAVQAKAS